MENTSAALDFQVAKTAPQISALLQTTLKKSPIQLQVGPFYYLMGLFFFP